VRDGRNGRVGRRRLPKGKRVARWPSYLLKDIPESERRSLSTAAAAQNISVSDVIRRLLCARYKLDCPPESYRYDPGRDGGNPDILLRLQPKLKAKIELEAGRTRRSKRDIMLETIAQGVT